MWGVENGATLSTSSPSTSDTGPKHRRHQHPQDITVANTLGTPDSPSPVPADPNTPACTPQHPGVPQYPHIQGPSTPIPSPSVRSTLDTSIPPSPLPSTPGHPDTPKSRCPAPRHHEHPNTLTPRSPAPWAPQYPHLRPPASWAPQRPTSNLPPPWAPPHPCPQLSSTPGTPILPVPR